MVAVAVGTLDDEGVDGARGRHRVTNDGQVVPADISREDEPVPFTLGDPDVHRRRAEDVAGVHEGGDEVLADMVGPIVRHRLDQVLHGDGVGHVVERFRLGTDPVVSLEEFEVALLDVRRVGEHDGGEVARGRGGDDRVVVPLLDQQGEAAGVIDVCMTHDDRVDQPRIEWELGVELARLGTASLEEARVEQHPGTRRLEEMHRAGDLAAGGAVEGYSHECEAGQGGSGAVNGTIGSDEKETSPPRKRGSSAFPLVPAAEAAARLMSLKRRVKPSRRAPCLPAHLPRFREGERPVRSFRRACLQHPRARGGCTRAR